MMCRMPRLVFGFMTGTSLDGLDAAAVRLNGQGHALRLLDIPAAMSLDFPEDLVESLRALCDGEALDAHRIADAARALGELHACAARELITSVGRPDFACAHGQTVIHRPPDSWQLLNPWPLAREAGCPVVYDLRGADLSAGGEGAPITPIADWVLFRAADESRAIVNLGGFCNVTHLPAHADHEAVRGMDVCACNHVLNAAARIALDQPFDLDGAAALRGTAVPTAVEALTARLVEQGRAGRSLGSGDELRDELRTLRGGHSPEDFLSSVVSAVARAIANAVASLSPGRVLLAGGSARNAALVRALQERLGPVPVAPTDSLGVPVAHRESVAFAVLGALCADRIAITIPTITGAAAPAPISGAWINTRPA
jgi:1,6-anhydro-N-acetylmuramate kinase